MQDEPRWLSLDTIIETNREEVAVTQEPFLVVDRGLLSSACARPRNLWAYESERDVVRLAAAYAVSIAKNHAFQQGNKRAGLTSAIMFIEMNGYKWVAADTDDVGIHLNNVLLKKMSERQFAEALRPFVVPN